MPGIHILDEQTIDQIAAGEVVERPSSVVKELVENAIDAKATAITVEIKDGGISLIRITDNGQGIPKEEVPLAFQRHATSKIQSAEDLLTVASLGFRGEALSSIAAVAQVELLTKTAREITGTKYVIEGSKELSIEEIGTAEGTTFLVRNLFFNTPARRKFLKSPQTEAAYVSSLIEKLALSQPGISIQFIVNNQPKLHTNGNTQLKDIIYHIYGKDIASGVLPINYEHELFTLDGFIGKPFISRGNRNFETYFINGRYIKSTLLTKCIEDAYKPFLMKHQYPFTVLRITMDSSLIDVNVHPSKMELRFRRSEELYPAMVAAINSVLQHKDMIPQVPLDEKSAGTKEKAAHKPDPFGKKKLDTVVAAIRQDSPYERKYVASDSLAANPDAQELPPAKPEASDRTLASRTDSPDALFTQKHGFEQLTIAESCSYHAGAGSSYGADASYGASAGSSYDADAGSGNYGADAGSGSNGADTESSYGADTESSYGADAKSSYGADTGSGSNGADTESSYGTDARGSSNGAGTGSSSYGIGTGQPDFVKEAKRRNYSIIGQLFDTYWLVQVENELFIIDQHAAHEKVLYEQLMKRLADKEFTSQQISPPVIVTMTMAEANLFHKYEAQFTRIGFEVNAFGGKEYAICAVPADLYNLNQKELFLNMLDGLSQESGRNTPEVILEKIASMSCKAAVKGRQHLSRQEAVRLIADLLELENPYNCPHGRPTIIAMSRMEIEKKFKRIV